MHYLGFQNQTKLEKIYEECLILVLPSLEESFGVPVIEALSKNCRVCASNTGALPEVGGLFANYFEIGNEHSFRKAVRTSLSKTLDWTSLSYYLDQFDRKAVSEKIKKVVQ